jgi:hypothetical protein
VRDLPRKLTLFDGAALLVGSVIGSGIFVVPSLIAHRVPEPGLVIGIWLFSGTAGFRRVTIRPFLGALERVSGSIPHPKGEITIALQQHEGILEAEVSLPEGISGEFVWKGERREIGPGRTRLRMGVR